MTPKLSITDRFTLELTDSLLDLNRMSVKLRSRVASAMRQLEGELARSVKAADIGAAASRAGRLRRAETAIRSATRDIRVRFKAIEKLLEKGILKIALRAGKDAEQTLNKVFGNGTVKRLSKTKLTAATKNEFVLGETLKEWLAAQQENLRRSVRRELRMAAVRTKETSDQTLERIRGTFTGRTIEVTFTSGDKQRLREHRGGVLDSAKQHADTTAETAVHAITQAIWLATYEQADEIIGYAAVTVLDGRTSKICIARTGARWFTNGEPMPDSTRDEQFPGSPPWHMRCRSSLTPLTAESAERLRVTTFDDWLESRGDDYARKKLGPGLFDLWKAGKITLAQLIDNAGNPLTLKELARR